VWNTFSENAAVSMKKYRQPSSTHLSVLRPVSDAITLPSNSELGLSCALAKMNTAKNWQMAMNIICNCGER
jgi:hypothetical protein